MKIPIKRFDKNIPLPKYSTDGSAAADAYSREDVRILPGELGYIPLNFAMDVPEGYFALLAARSSTHKMGIMPVNGIGVLDSDFSGDNDEPLFIVYNFTENEVVIEKGTRVAQLILMKHEKFEFDERDSLGNEDRGGIGSTGRK